MAVHLRDRGDLPAVGQQLQNEATDDEDSLSSNSHGSGAESYCSRSGGLGPTHRIHRAPRAGRCEITTLRYRVLNVAARTTHSARQVWLRIDATWRWATPIAIAWQRIRTVFG
ncbi:hypothetical protein NJB18091_37080 [Mycobacterium marinum]|nr:hypothetical protein NJB18091_37080 [Mycobacterium marinum]